MVRCGYHRHLRCSSPIQPAAHVIYCSPSQVQEMHDSLIRELIGRFHGYEINTGAQWAGQQLLKGVRNLCLCCSGASRRVCRRPRCSAYWADNRPASCVPLLPQRAMHSTWRSRTCRRRSCSAWRCSTRQAGGAGRVWVVYSSAAPSWRHLCLGPPGWKYLQLACALQLSLPPPLPLPSDDGAGVAARGAAPGALQGNQGARRFTCLPVSG